MITGKTRYGLQYAVKRSGSAAAYCALSIKCGTRDEDGFHNGIAHFTEHTVFKGTNRKKARVINEYIDKLGGELNAFTTKEEIVIHTVTLKEDLYKAASLALELATCPTFPEDEINIEKGVVIDEINSYKDTPSEDIYDKFEEMFFDGHPLGKPILGTVASVKKITPEELHRFVGEKFIAPNMVLSMVADIDEKAMEKRILALADKFFVNENHERQVCTEEFVCPEPKQFDKSVNKRNHQTNCVIGALAPSLYSEKERMATVLLCNILGGPASNSILNSVLREKNGWVYNVECSYNQYSDCGIVVIGLGCDRENLDKCLHFIDKELFKLQTEPLSEYKLKKAKRQLLGQIAISSEQGETECLSMGKSMMAFGKVRSEEELKSRIEAVTASELQNLAQKIFSTDKLSKLIYY